MLTVFTRTVGKRLANLKQMHGWMSDTNMLSRWVIIGDAPMQDLAPVVTLLNNEVSIFLPQDQKFGHYRSYLRGLRHAAAVPNTTLIMSVDDDDMPCLSGISSLMEEVEKIPPADIYNCGLYTRWLRNRKSGEFSSMKDTYVPAPKDSGRTAAADWFHGRAACNVWTPRAVDMLTEDPHFLSGDMTIGEDFSNYCLAYLRGARVAQVDHPIQYVQYVWGENSSTTSKKNFMVVEYPKIICYIYTNYFIPDREVVKLRLTRLLGTRRYTSIASRMIPEADANLPELDEVIGYHQQYLRSTY